MTAGGMRMSEIPDLSSMQRYDVLLYNRSHGETLFDVGWGIDVDRKRAIDAVQELLILKEKDSNGNFAGDIVVRPVHHGPIPNYPKCQEDSTLSSNGVGGSVSVLRTVRTTSSIDYQRAQRQLEDQSLIGECCGCTAMRHSIHPPFPCRDCGDCQRWDSGE
jgi:hypothetical protein